MSSGREVALVPGVQPEEGEAVRLEGETILAEDPDKARAAVTQPVCVVVAGQDAIRRLKPVEDSLGLDKLRIAALFGHVAGDEHESDGGVGVDRVDQRV